MVQSADEKRGYVKGYYRAGVRGHERVRRVINLARRYIARLEDRDTDRVCKTCDRWTRGAGLNNSEACMWGSCRADFEWSVEPRMWIDAPLGTPQDRIEQAQITTQPDFGCASWIPKRGVS